MDAQIIPPWVVSALAALAALALWSVRPMPWRIRLSLILPVVYIALEYLWFSLVVVPSAIRVDLTRVGLILLFCSVICNAGLACWHWNRAQQHER